MHYAVELFAPIFTFVLVSHVGHKRLAVRVVASIGIGPVYVRAVVARHPARPRVAPIGGVIVVEAAAGSVTVVPAETFP
jgi:hypothetical protein